MVRSVVSSPQTMIALDPKEMKMKLFLLSTLVLSLAAAFAGHDGKASGADDQKIVAALDAQYQAAVEKNDASIMDRILADDFVLVTGSGKTQSKADLLEEARSGRVVYEYQ